MRTVRSGMARVGVARMGTGALDRPGRANLGSALGPRQQGGENRGLVSGHRSSDAEARRNQKPL